MRAGALSIAAWAVAAFAAAPLLAVEIDGVAATVGGDSILKSDVIGEMKRMGVGDDSRYREALDRLVEKKLILKAAADSKLNIQDWVVENRVREIVEVAFGGDRNNLTAALQREKISYADWRERVREDIVIGAMRWNIVDKYVTATPGEMRREYAENAAKYVEGGKTSVAVILLRPGDAAKRKEIDRALKTTDFGEIAKKYSADSKAKDGGVWKDIDPKETFQSAIAEEIAKMPPNTLSEWLDVDGWSFLLKKLSSSGARKLSFSEAYPRIEREVKKSKGEKLYKDWIDRLKSNVYIKYK